VKESEVLVHAALWLDGQTGIRVSQLAASNEDIIQAVEHMYPTGFDGFREDIIQANGVS
jgi:hypothetical protein